MDSVWFQKRVPSIPGVEMWEPVDSLPAREMSTRDALKRARALAKELGCRVQAMTISNGRLIAITEQQPREESKE